MLPSYEILPYIPADTRPKRAWAPVSNLLSIAGVTFTPTNGAPVPLRFAGAPAELLAPLAAIILNWALLDRFFREATALLIDYNAVPVNDWWKSDISRVLRLHDEQFKLAFRHQEDILVHHAKQVMKRAWEGRLIRNLIGHAQITAGSSMHGPALTFISKKIAKKSIRTFYIDDLSSAAGNIAASSGFLDELFTAADSVPVSDHSKSVLKSTLSSVKWNSAIDKAFDVNVR